VADSDISLTWFRRPDNSLSVPILSAGGVKEGGTPAHSCQNPLQGEALFSLKIKAGEGASGMGQNLMLSAHGRRASTAGYKPTSQDESSRTPFECGF